MKISELPTPRLRARAMELALGSAEREDCSEDCQLADAFTWINAPEKFGFWNACYWKDWDKAKQACQDHLQAYVDGLYLQLQELTED